MCFLYVSLQSNFGNVSVPEIGKSWEYSLVCFLEPTHSKHKRTVNQHIALGMLVQTWVSSKAYVSSVQQPYWQLSTRMWHLPDVHIRHQWHPR